MLVFGPLETVREAAWHTLRNARIPAPIIDVEKNLVSGAQGDGILVAVRVTTVRFEEKPEGILVSFERKSILGGGDLVAKWWAKTLADSFQRILANGYASTPDAQPLPVVHAPPLADPTGAGNTAPILLGRPHYGPILAHKRGVTILCYGILSLLFPVLAPSTIIYGIRGLVDYKRLGDPGDRRFLVAGMAISVLGTLLLCYYVKIFLR